MGAVRLQLICQQKISWTYCTTCNSETPWVFDAIVWRASVGCVLLLTSLIFCLSIFVRILILVTRGFTLQKLFLGRVSAVMVQ